MSTARDERSASEWATTASMPRVRQARRMRSAISPRLAMRMRSNIRWRSSVDGRAGRDRTPPVLRRGTRRLAVLDRLAGGRDRSDDDAVDRRGHVVLDAEHLDVAEEVAAADGAPDLELRTPARSSRPPASGPRRAGPLAWRWPLPRRGCAALAWQGRSAEPRRRPGRPAARGRASPRCAPRAPRGRSRAVAPRAPG